MSEEWQEIAKLESANKSLEAEAERLREEVRELKGEKLRIFKAFSCANAALKFHPQGDNRSDGDCEEAERLIAYETGER